MLNHFLKKEVFALCVTGDKQKVCLRVKNRVVPGDKYGMAQEGRTRTSSHLLFSNSVGSATTPFKFALSMSSSTR